MLILNINIRAAWIIVKESRSQFDFHTVLIQPFYDSANYILKEDKHKGSRTSLYIVLYCFIYISSQRGHGQTPNGVEKVSILYL